MEAAPIATIDQYIEAQAEALRPTLHRLRETIRAAAPEADERISWQMPTFWKGENLVHFAPAKKHIGLYPGGEAVGVFAQRLSGYKTSKGAIQFPLDRPMDLELIADIVRWRVAASGQKGKKPKRYDFDAPIRKVPDLDGAYVEFPHDLRTEFGRGRVKVLAAFDGVLYAGSIANMGVTKPDGSVCYILGLRKDIRARLGKGPGDMVHVVIIERV